MTLLKSPTDLGKYDLKTMPFPVSPMLIHKIQDSLMTFEPDILSFDILSASIVSYRGMALKPLINILHKASIEDRERIVKLIGATCMGWIEEYMAAGGEDDIPPQLFKSPGLYQDTEGCTGMGC